MNAIIDQDESVFVLTPEAIELRDELAAIGAELLKGGFYFRLIMTDDLINMAEIRKRARESKEQFFYGCALRDDFQRRIDGMTRKYRTTLIDAICAGKEMQDELGIEGVYDPAQKAYLVTLRSCGMGFYVSEFVRQSRQNRPKRMTLKDVAHQVTATPVKESTRSPKEQPVTRRKFTVIRTISN